MSATDPTMTPVLPPRSGGRGSTVLVAAGILLLTFIVGLILGVVGDRIWQWAHPRPLHPSASFIASRLDRRLHFTPQQRKEVERIIAQRQDRIGHIWESVRPQVRQEIDQTNAEIERILTPEQRAEFAKIRMRLMPRRDGRGIRFRHD